MFIISALIYLMGAIVYGIFGTGDIQNWATRSRDIEIKTHRTKTDESGEVSSSSGPPKIMVAKDLGIITPPQNSSFSFSESSFTVPAAPSSSSSNETKPIVKH